MNPVSAPKNAAIPTTPFYFVSPTLEQFERSLNRAAFKNKFDGAQARPYNPAYRIKDWFDTSDFSSLIAGIVTYLIFDPTTNTIKPTAMTVDEAANPNLPGPYDYPQYANDPTPATWTDKITGITKALDNWNLISQEDAIELSAEIGGGTPVEGTYDPATQFNINWNGETRRNWLIPWQGSKQTAAAMKAEKNAFGVGAPGHWDPSNPEQLKWVRETPNLGLNDKRPHAPMPVRALYTRADGSPLEVLSSEIFTPGLVYRNDMPSPFNPVK